MENYFLELNKINVSDKTEKKLDLTYLSWAHAWTELKKIKPNANYIIHENSQGLPYFESDYGFACKVSVIVDEITHTMWLPVMDNANKSMKKEEYKYRTKYEEKICQAINMFDINKTIMRALVKAIAMHGLGLSIYTGEDLPVIDNDPLLKIKDKIKNIPITSLEYKKIPEKVEKEIKKITQKQVMRLFALLKENPSKDTDKLKIYLKNNYNIESSADILMKDYEKICLWIQEIEIPEEDKIEFEPKKEK